MLVQQHIVFPYVTNWDFLCQTQMQSMWSLLDEIEPNYQILFFSSLK